MNSSPFISVVIPAFNCAAFISRTLDSVLAQAREDLEILVVNDGSTDETAAVLSSYGNKIRVIHQDNQGVASARNRAIEFTRGEWIAFLDSDDVWHTNKLGMQVKTLAAYPASDIVFSGFRMVDPQDRCLVHDAIRSYYGLFSRQSIDWLNVFSGGSTSVDGCDVYFGDCYPTLFQGNFIKTSTVMVRRESLAKAGAFRSDLRTEEDYELWLRLCGAGPAAYIDCPLVDARRHPDQLTSLGNARIVADNVARVMSLVKADASRRLGEAVVWKRMADIHRHLAVVSLLHGEHRCARQAAVRSMRYGSRDPRLLGIVIWSLLPGGLTRGIGRGVRASRSVFAAKNIGG